VKIARGGLWARCDRGPVAVRGLVEKGEGAFHDVTGLVDQDEGGTGIFFDKTGRDFHRFGFANAFCARLLFAVANHFPIFQFTIRSDPENDRFLHDLLSARGKRFASARLSEKSGEARRTPI
jgi:hypothetical protein